MLIYFGRSNLIKELLLYFVFTLLKIDQMKPSLQSKQSDVGEMFYKHSF